VWHNRVFDRRFLCLADDAQPDHGFIVWDRCNVFPVVHAAAGPGLCDLAGGCNVIASGPSVLDIPNRQRLLDRYSVVVNGAHAAVERGDRRFDLYVVTDPSFVHRNWDLFCAGLDVARSFAADHRVYVEILERDPRVLAGRRLVLFNNPCEPYLGRRIGPEAWRDLPRVRVSSEGAAFSGDPSVGVFPGETVVYSCLQLLCGWGFRDIYLFGVDLTGGVRSYAEAVPAPSRLRCQYEKAILPSFRLAAEAARAWGVALWNCSPVSLLPTEVLPKLAPEIALGGGAQARDAAGNISAVGG
jgi:hypothetical protein